MIDTVLQIILAALALGFLVFIHELGHYFVALRSQMNVEVFSIGFGRPITSWMHGKVRWQIGWLPFGGYVKIAGMELGKNEKTDVPGGFFTKSPWDRLKVAAAGPLANLLFALVLFFVIWAFGGREKPFIQYTDRIGWVDPRSELFQSGVRPGDILTKVNGKAYQEYKDLLIASLGKESVALEGFKVDEETGEREPFSTKAKLFGSSLGIDGFTPARYLIYIPLQKHPSEYPIDQSGIERGDRLVWANGDVLYSVEQLSHLVNLPKALLTVQREGKTFFARVPRVTFSELKLSSVVKEELSDLQYMSGLKGRFSFLHFIPYMISSDGFVESEIPFIDPELKKELSEKISSVDQVLQPGDRIVAIDTLPVRGSKDILQLLQEPHTTVIVQRGFEQMHPTPEEANAQFNQPDFLRSLAHFEGNPSFVLLHPVVPKPRQSLVQTEEEKALLLQQRKQIESISDPHKRATLLRQFEEEQKRLALGIAALADESVQYNPGPFALFGKVIEDTGSTLVSLFSGELNPKYLSGPVGIVQVIQHGWAIGIKEALYWVGLISINLGILNLLPIPVLDGGYIVLSLVELITKRKIKPKTLEKIIFPFVVLLIGFLIFVTYYDITRLF